MPRLFVALDLPASVKKSLEPLAKGLGDVRWLSPEQQHLTLRFIGDVANGALHDVAEALATVPAQPFQLTLKGLGHFPPRGEPRVLWVGLEKNAELASLKRRVDRALREAEVPPETRKFAPHVTIARIRAPLSPTRLGTYLMRHSLYRSESCAVPSGHLYWCGVGADGAEHHHPARDELVPGIEGDFD